MGFGHRVYRAYDPRAAALRTVAEGMEHKPDWLAARDRGRGRRAAGPGREAPGAPAQDERRVLRRAGADGRRPVTGPLPGDVLAGAARRLDRPRPRAGREQPPDPPGRRTTSAPRSATSRPEHRQPLAGGTGAPAATQQRRHRQPWIPQERDSAGPRPGHGTFMPKMLAMSVSGSSTTLTAVRIRNESFSRCDSTDSLVDSSASIDLLVVLERVPDPLRGVGDVVEVDLQLFLRGSAASSARGRAARRAAAGRSCGS